MKDYEEMQQAMIAMKEVVLRDAFAQAALQGMLAHHGPFYRGQLDCAKAAYRFADAMMIARENNG